MAGCRHIIQAINCLRALVWGLSAGLCQVMAGARDPTPGVTWESIAALEDAKRLLNEAVVLPLLIPPPPELAPFFFRPLPSR